MKKYTLLAVLLIGGLFVNNLTAQNNVRSAEERQAMHNDAKKSQQLAAVQSEVQSIIFRFESAYEDKDLKSTTGLQKNLATLMKSAIDYRTNNGGTTDEKTIELVENFSKYAFDFSRVESKQDIAMKGIPSEFMKTLK